MKHQRQHRRRDGGRERGPGEAHAARPEGGEGDGRDRRHQSRRRGDQRHARERHLTLHHALHGQGHEFEQRAHRQDVEERHEHRLLVETRDPGRRHQQHDHRDQRRQRQDRERRTLVAGRQVGLLDEVVDAREFAQRQHQIGDRGGDDGDADFLRMKDARGDHHGAEVQHHRQIALERHQDDGSANGIHRYVPQRGMPRAPVRALKGRPCGECNGAAIVPA